MSEQIVIYLDKVSKAYIHSKKNMRKPVKALKELSLQIKEGEILGLIGPNGAGKTTAIKIIMGLSFPTRGVARIFDLPPGSKAANHNIGYVSEIAYYYPFLEASTLLSYYAKLAGVNKYEIPKRVMETLEMVQLASHADRRIGEYSKGMQQRLGIAQSLLHAPKLLVLDEPTSGLDPIGQHEVISILARLRTQGITILLSSHQLSEIEGLCKNIVIIHKGRSLFHGTINELSSSSPSSQTVTIRFSNYSSSIFRLPTLGFADKAPQGEYEVNINKDMVNNAIDELRKEGCSINTVVPLAPKLNEIFYQMISNADKLEEE